MNFMGTNVYFESDKCKERDDIVVFWFCFFWVSWCVLHSLLVNPRVAEAIQLRLGRFSGYYRSGYNIFSLLTLIPLIVFTVKDGGEIVFSWTGWTVAVRFLLLGLAFFCFTGGAKGYNLQYFLGLEQIRGARDSVLLGDRDSFSEEGIFGFIRHPWYAGSLLLVWSLFGTYHLKSFVLAVMLSVYICIGTLLEERKILATHSEAYGRYRKRVSMYFPLKWLRRNCF